MADVLCQSGCGLHRSVSIRTREMSSAEAALALAPFYGDLNPEDLMWLFKNLNLL